MNLRKRAGSAFTILILLLGIMYYLVSSSVKPTPAATYAIGKGLSNDIMAELTVFDSDQTLNQSEVDFINYVSVFAEPLQKKLVVGFLSDGKLVSQETRQIDFLKQFPVEEQAKFIENGRHTNTDWDGDKMDNYFEQNIASLPYDVGNGRYALLVGTGRGSGGMNIIERFLISEEEFSPQNVINLSYENATMENFAEAVSDLSEKASENDIVCVCLSGQGNNDCFYFNDGKGSDKSPKAAMSFADIDNYLDSIRPMKMLVTVAVSSSVNAIELLKEGSSPRVLANIEPH